jgi:hypothetical protein
MSAIDHIKFLSHDIGPRGSTREGEARAVEYSAGILESLDLTPNVNSFMSARSNWHPYALFSAIMLIAIASFLLGGEAGSVAALILAGLSLVSVLFELSFRPNPLRLRMEQTTMRPAPGSSLASPKRWRKSLSARPTYG